MSMLRYFSIFCILLSSSICFSADRISLKNSIVTEALRNSLTDEGKWKQIEFWNGSLLTSVEGLSGSYISNTNGSSSGLVNHGTFTTDYLSFGGTSVTHDGQWTETSSGTHTITSPTIYLNSSDVRIDALGLLSNYRKYPVYACEFMATGASSYDPFLGAAISSGTIGSVGNSVLTGNSPGVQKITSSTNADSGYSVKTGVITVLIGGGEVLSATYNIQSATATTRIGFIDTSTFAQPVDGAWLSYNGTMTVVGNTANSSTYSTTTSSFTGTVNTWYRGVVVIGSSATTVTYTIYNTDGVSLWTDSLSTNIPTTSGRDTGMGVISTSPGTVATDLLLIDWMGIGWTKALTR